MKEGGVRGIVRSDLPDFYVNSHSYMKWYCNMREDVADTSKYSEKYINDR